MDISAKKLLGMRVRELREERGYGDRSSKGGKVAFCELAHISRPELDAIEQGRFDAKISTLEKLARALEVELYELFKF